MPLVDPVTMSSSARTTGPATAPKAKSRTDEPTPTNPGLLAQQATHIVPVLQLALFAGRFGTLVADPVATMTSTLPFVAALQVAYALICLPPAGAGSAAAAKLPKKTGRADRKKPAAAQGAAPNVYVVRTPGWSTCLRPVAELTTNQLRRQRS
jgi:phosphatidylinositol glycan class F